MRKKIAIVTTSPLPVNFFLQDHVREMCKIYHVTIVVNALRREELGGVAELVDFIPMKIHREISMLADIAALFGLYRLFRDKSFDLIHSLNPKAGLLCIIAAWLSGAKCRLHTFTGQVWVTRKGISRLLLKMMDKITARLATIVLVDSHSQRDFLVDEGVVTITKSRVLADGSISGVNLDRFYPDHKQRADVRNEIGISVDAKVVAYIGRLKRDKGVLDLAQAFVEVRQKIANAVLLLVGPDEEKLLPVIADILGENGVGYWHVPYTRNPENYMRTADILCLPSYREGFGTIVIEAAACEVPSIATRIYGLTDAVIDGKTGLLADVADIPGFASAIVGLLSNEELRIKLGVAARMRAEKLFRQERITQELLEVYSQLLVEQDIAC
jgi:glycosyltransferase involved in cell wall biosynthesis